MNIFKASRDPLSESERLTLLGQKNVTGKIILVNGNKIKYDVSAIQQTGFVNGPSHSFL